MVLLGGLATHAMAASSDLNAAYILQVNNRIDAAATQPVSELEAKLWILNAGYDQVSGLETAGPGMYQGTALSNGDTYDVVVDSAGNVLGVKE
jgi:hypothetical protein